MAQAYVALGANLGDREAAIVSAVARLAELGMVAAVSPIYETDPVGYLDQPAFLNAVARLETALAPGALLAGLMAIERDAGRQRSIHHGPRTLDLDLLLYDDQTIDLVDLTVPHPRMRERAFVLVPLADLAPDLVIPGQTRSVRDLRDGLGDTGAVVPYPGDRPPVRSPIQEGEQEGE